MHDEPKPRARGGLLSSDHSKRGRRFVSILDEEAGRVTLLEPWEHAILVLSDGSRGPREIAALLDEGVEGEPVTLDGVQRCLHLFEHQQLIEPLTRGCPEQAPAGPRTLANLQLAYREWHKDPAKTGQILAGDPNPFVNVEGGAPTGLSPTVALPEDEAPAPVSIGTKLVMGTADGDLQGGDRPLRSVFERSEEARTEIGALDASPRGGGSYLEAQAAEGVDDDDDVLDIEELDDLELGDVADLLAAVDDDFDALEEEAEPQVPPVKAMGGEASLPPARPEAPATAELVVPEGAHGYDGQEAALTPTMVGRPAPDGAGPEIISPPRPHSAPPREVGRGFEDGDVVEDTQRFDLPTEASFAAQDPLAIDSRPRARHASVPPVQEETTNRSAAHLPARARLVFERLWDLGLSARAQSEESLDAQDRRRRGAEAAQFQAGLERLTAGELELALVHFDALEARLPSSTRVRAFADTIRVALDEGTAAGPETDVLLRRFTDAVDDAIAAGRCPRCLCGLQRDDDTCAFCGLRTGRPADVTTPAG